MKKESQVHRWLKLSTALQCNATSYTETAGNFGTFTDIIRGGIFCW